jgi:hypothetical protein
MEALGPMLEKKHETESLWERAAWIWGWHSSNDVRQRVEVCGSHAIS